MVNLHATLSVASLSVWALSSAVYVKRKLKEQRSIRLSLDNNDIDNEIIDEDQIDNIASTPDHPIAEQDQLSREESQAFNIVEQSIDGQPVNQDAYLRHIRHSRIALIICALISLALMLAQLFLRSKRHHPIRWYEVYRESELWPLITNFLLWSNIFFITIHDMHSRSPWSASVQAAVLTMFASITDITLLVVPGAVQERDLLFYGMHALLAIVALSISIIIPSGPRYIKMTEKGTVPMARVSSKGMTIMSRIWFTNCIDIVRTARNKGKLDPIDVPQMGSDLDARRLYIVFRRNFIKYSSNASISSKQAKSKKSTLQKCWPMLRAVVSSNRNIFTANVLLSAASGVSFYVPYYVSFQIVRFLEDAERDGQRRSGWQRLRFSFPYCLLLVACTLFTSLAMGQLFATCITWLRTRIRAQLQMMIFAKALRRKDVGGVEEFKKKDAKTDVEDDDDDDDHSSDDDSKGGKKQSSFSKTQVINLVSVDAERISDVSYLITIFMAPVEILVGGFFAVYLLKWGAVVGLLSSLAMQPVVFFIGKLMTRLEEHLQETRDRKTSLLNEVIQAIRMVKFNAWEAKAGRRVRDVRKEELKYQRYIYLTDILQSYIFNFTPALVMIVSYAWTALVEKKALTPSVAFTAFVVLDELRFSLNYIPEAIAEIIQALVSLGRIQRYLDSAEVDGPHDDLASAHRTAQSPPSEEIFFTNATVRWPQAESKDAKSSSASVLPSRDDDPSRSTTFCLNDVSLKFTSNALNLVVGRLGSGKTLLMQGLLGEADLLCGQMSCPRSAPDSIRNNMKILPDQWMRSDQLAYVPQTAFLVNATLRDNVLFGLPMLEDRYAATLEACGLQPDLKLLEDGDETEIGENGIGLSGGQTIRVMLARAVYGRASTLLLDDPLSAVDAHTAAHIHTRLLRGPLCAKRTVILVTHQVQLVAQSSAQVIMLDSGRVVYQGEPIAFMKSDLYGGLIEEQEEEKGEPTTKDLDPSTAESSMTNTPSTTAPPSPRLASKDVTVNGDDVGSTVPKSKTPAKKLVEEEKRATGAVLLSIYARYLRSAGGIKMVSTTLILFFIVNILPVVVKRWMQSWTDDVLHEQQGKTRQHSDQWWLFGLTVLSITEITMDAFKMLALTIASLRASKILFNEMLTSVLKAPLRFHDTVSRGRLLNRFGYDFQEMDSEMVDVFERLIDQLFVVVTSIGAIATGGGAPFLLFFALMIPLYAFIGRLYMLAIRDMKRLSSVTRSPILNSFGDAVRGTVIIRAFGASLQFQQTLVDRINENSAYVIWMNELRWWYEELFHTISDVVILVAITIILLNESISASQAAFIFTFLLNFNLYIIFMLRSYTDLEQKLVSVERIVEYSNLEGEGVKQKQLLASTNSPVNMSTEWPAQGQVEVKDLHVRYAADLPEVLKGVSFSIPPKSKVGIVGPTGCGKSTLASTFFRFVDITKGSILVDGVNVEDVDLQTLRSRLQIVPQDPIIFSGPLRASLDVFDEYTDAQVLDALRKVQLIGEGDAREPHALASNADADEQGSKRDFGDLTFMVSEGGSNLSNGEKQLLCLARAILRRCHLILFDEATSSVDFDTDAIISQIIRQEFRESTIITIAHRLRTIIDYDYVLVLEEGRVVEFASPTSLLQDSKSRFYKLCRATGKRELAFLKKAAGLE